MEKNSVVLADDHQFLLDGIISVLKEIPLLEIAGTANNGFDLVEMVLKLRPDLVILDLNMPGYDGLQCVQKIKQQTYGIKILVLSNYSQPELIAEVKNRKAEGYLVKNSTAAELKEAVIEILSGKEYYKGLNDIKPMTETSYFFDDFLKKYQLTKREVEIIKLVGRELSSKQIAEVLFLSELTIATHRRNILRKLDVKNVAGLVNFAKENMLF